VPAKQFFLQNADEELAERAASGVRGGVQPGRRGARELHGREDLARAAVVTDDAEW